MRRSCLHISGEAAADSAPQLAECLKDEDPVSWRNMEDGSQNTTASQIWPEEVRASAASAIGWLTQAPKASARH